MRADCFVYYNPSHRREIAYGPFKNVIALKKKKKNRHVKLHKLYKAYAGSTTLKNTTTTGATHARAHTVRPTTNRSKG